jgi:hypothetical protein
MLDTGRDKRNREIIHALFKARKAILTPLVSKSYHKMFFRVCSRKPRKMPFHT